MVRALGMSFLALLAGSAAGARQFPETGYSITHDGILDYFDHRGGARVFGPPISREFDFMGTRVQFFQRAVLQVQPNGNVALLNLLSEDLLPYTRINGSTFPAADAQIVGAAPSPAEPDYAARAISFVRVNAPDSWEGMNTNFFSTMMNTVRYEDAFPRGDADQGLMPLVNLEIWGLPTSKPRYDPANGNFVYLRFQRGIMHFDKTSGTTQGILLGDHLKSVITGRDLPADLAADAAGSNLYRQYDNSRLGGLARPGDLPATDLFAAFEKDGVVVPAPIPATAAPVATAAPAATARPVATPAPQAPANIEVVGGGPRFQTQIYNALLFLEQKSPYNYALVKQNVYRIQFVDSSTSSTDFATRTLNFNEATAYPEPWSHAVVHQQEWVAGLIVHNMVHIAQHYRGEPLHTPEAEREAMLRQHDALAGVETTGNPPGQFRVFVQNGLDNNTGWWSDYQIPPGPLEP